MVDYIQVEVELPLLALRHGRTIPSPFTLLTQAEIHTMEDDILRERIEDALKERQMSKRELYAAISAKGKVGQQIDDILLEFMAAGLVVGVVVKPGPKGGKPKQIYKWIGKR